MFTLRCTLAALVVTLLFAATPSRAQDPQQIMQQLTDLQQQLANGSDPCPLMPRLKALIHQIATQSPDIYNAMKPTLDLLNSQDDGCSNSTAPAASSAASDASQQQAAQQQAAAQQAAQQRAQAAAAQQQAGQPSDSQASQLTPAQQAEKDKADKAKIAKNATPQNACVSVTGSTPDKVTFQNNCSYELTIYVIFQSGKSNALDGYMDPGSSQDAYGSGPYKLSVCRSAYEPKATGTFRHLEYTDSEFYCYYTGQF